MVIRRRDSLDQQSGVYPFFGVSRPFDPEDKFVTARFLPPLAFGLLRLLIGFYSIVVVIVDIVLTATTGDIDSYFSYFTDITYIALTFYFLFASFHTLWYARTGKSPLNRWYRPFQLAHTVLFSTIITYPIIVTIVFWTLLSSGSTFATAQSTWSNISKHALNSAYCLFEILFSAVGLQPWSHIIFLVLFLAMYLGVAYITKATQGFYVYSFLNPSKGPILAAYIVGILVGSIFVFAIVNLVKWGLAKSTSAKTRDGWRDRYEMRNRDSSLERGKSGESL